MSPKDDESVHAALRVLIRAVDEKYKILFEETEKRNGQRFDAQEKAVLAALNSAERAVSKAEMAVEKRFESVNEFRQTLSDQTAGFVTRQEYSVQHGTLIDRLSSLEKRAEATTGRSLGIGSVGTFVIGTAAVVAAVATIASVIIVLVHR